MSDKIYPANWQVRDSYDPSEHLINLKGKDYLNAQNRLLWFIKDMRSMILTGAATTSYVVRTELIELDREAGYAHFKTYVRDVLGNEATMYGSETARDFGDYAEKASTKSLGRALLALGYGTANALEMDEGERVVDSPVEPKQTQRTVDGGPVIVNANTKRPQPPLPPSPMAAIHMPPADEHQMKQIKQMSGWLKREMPEVSSAEQAVSIIAELDQLWSEELDRRRHAEKQARIPASLKGLPGAQNGARP